MTKKADNFSSLKKLIEQKQYFIVVSHIFPDGDSLGSTLAMGLALKKAGKKVEMICPDKIPAKYTFLPGSTLLQKTMSAGPLPDSSIIMVLDCSDEERLGDFAEQIPSFPVVNIDHHSSNKFFGQVNIINKKAAATGEILFCLLDDLQLLDKDIALNLYVAIATDTGSFKYANTTSTTHNICAKLLDSGLHPHDVSQKVFDEKPISTLLLMKEVIGTLSVEVSGRVAWMKVDDSLLKKCGAQKEELDGLVNYAKNITGVEVGLLFYIQEDGEIKVALRSKDMVDVAKIAEKFGGGGHRQAAGCRFNNIEFDIVRETILNHIGGTLKIGQP